MGGRAVLLLREGLLQPADLLLVLGRRAPPVVQLWAHAAQVGLQGGNLALTLRRGGLHGVPQDENLMADEQSVTKYTIRIQASRGWFDTSASLSWTTRTRARTLRWKCSTSSWAEYSSSLVVEMVFSRCSLKASMSACSFPSWAACTHTYKPGDKVAREEDLEHRLTIRWTVLAIACARPGLLTLQELNLFGRLLSLLRVAPLLVFE